MKVRVVVCTGGAGHLVWQKTNALIAWAFNIIIAAFHGDGLQLKLVVSLPSTLRSGHQAVQGASTLLKRHAASCIIILLMH